MKKLTFILFACFFANISNVSAFCGFYVAKADTKLYNEASQVILVRDGNKTTISMSNDFSGSAKDFAMVVPVPVVLQRENIRIINRSLFDSFDAYSSPRLAEYYDQDPCQMIYAEKLSRPKPSTAARPTEENEMAKSADALGVTIEAEYSVGEYDILILSATESVGLEKWLIANGYKIPAGAQEVLKPYIWSNTKFFVVKVNMEAYQSSGFQQLNPLQINFESPKFMLPIRLGMANSKGNQDLIIYALSKKGRIECTNYPTIEIPSNKNIPEFIKNDFGSFYKDLFARQWKTKGAKNVFLEYAWDISPNNYVKCDPCVSTPPNYSEIADAGVNWLNDNTYHYDSNKKNYYQNENSNTLYFTRLHVRYNRASFAQDLMFQETPNTQNFQARYVLTHPAQSSFNCEAAVPYLQKTVQNRRKELNELATLTGKSTTGYSDYVARYNNLLPANKRLYDKNDSPVSFLPNNGDDNDNFPNTTYPVILLSFVFILSILTTLLFVYLKKKVPIFES